MYQNLLMGPFDGKYFETREQPWKILSKYKENGLISYHFLLLKWVNPLFDTWISNTSITSTW